MHNKYWNYQKIIYWESILKIIYTIKLIIFQQGIAFFSVLILILI